MRNSRNVKSFSRGYLRFACFFPVEPFFPGAGLFFRFAVAPERPGAERLPAALVFSGYFFPTGRCRGSFQRSAIAEGMLVLSRIPANRSEPGPNA